MQIVIARYLEEISWIEKLAKDNPSFFIRLYNKGGTLEKKPGIYTTNLPNMGREADTFLRHIIDTYENTFEYTAFLQGNPFYHEAKTVEKLESSSRISLEPLGTILTCDKYGNPNAMGLPLESTYFKIFGTNKTEFEFSAGAQWIVHRDLIKNKSLGFWRKLYDIYLSTESAPWVFERLWQDIYKFKE